MISNCLAIFLNSYLGFRATETISFAIDDGWCNLPHEGIGDHCFGDFYSPLRFVNLTNPWGGAANPYPPLTNFVLKPFYFLREEFMLPNLSLAIYFLLGFIGLYLMVKDATKLLDFGRVKSFILGTFVCTSAPIIVALDRGNNQIFLIPLVYLFFKFCLQDNFNKAIYIGVILVLFKPQFILFGTFFLTIPGKKLFLKWLTLNIATFSATFILYPVGLKNNIYAYFMQLVDFQNYTPAGSLNPVNLSIPNSIGVIEKIVRVFRSQSDLSYAERVFHATPLTVFLLLFVIYIFRREGSYRTPLSNLLLASLLVITLPNISYHYYLSLLIPFFIFFISDYQPKNLSFKRDPLRRNSARLSLSLVLIFGFIPWQFPWALLPIFEYLGTKNLGINWLICQFSLLFLLLSLLIPIDIKRFGIKI